MEQTISVCLFNELVAPGYHRMGISCAESYRHAEPGQFVMAGTPNETFPFLRRPFSIHGLLETDGFVRGIEILFKVVGPATRRMAGYRGGETISLLGPLGKGFTILPEYRKVLVVAGGIGVAPLVFLVRRMAESGMDLRSCEVFLGGRSGSDILCEDAFLNAGCRVRVTTDDGSMGDQCLVTHPVEKALSAGSPDMMYACGPDAMLRCLSGYAAKYRIPCQVSVETMMACGVGACLGCAVPDPADPGRYRHVCKDGPVFGSSQIY